MCADRRRICTPYRLGGLKRRMENLPNWVAMDRLEEGRIEISDPDADVLMVEDDAAIAEMYALALSMGGLRVRIVPSGESAVLEAEAHQSYDVIVLDLELPRMDGMATLDELKHLEATANIPVIVLSNGEVDPSEVERRGAREWHAKYRTTPSQLLDYVRRVRLTAA
jgi:DNA-binding response OmpR family regulator